MIKPADLAKAIRSRGVAFDSEDAAMKRMKDSGAGDDLLVVIREVRPPKPKKVEPPPPPKVVTGTLALHCAPVECTVLIDNNPFAETKGGILRTQLPVGRHTVIFSRAGYSQDQQVANLTEAGVVLSATLKPDEATKSRLGGELLKRLLQAAGDDSVDLVAKGSWTRSTGGIPIERLFALRFGPKDTVLILNSQAGGLQVLCEGEICQTRKDTIGGLKELRPKKELKGSDAQQAESELKFFRRYFSANVVREVRAGANSGRLRPSAESEEPSSDGHYRFTLASNDERYTLELDRQYLLAEVTHDFGPNLERREIATYSDYASAGRGKYPKRIQIKASDAKEGLITVRFESFTPAANK